MYSERLMELFRSASHAGRLEDATHYGEGGVPGQGPYIQLWLKVADGTVQAARFKCYGCPAAIACAEAACRWSEGLALSQVGSLTAEALTDWVGGLPEGKEHCAAIAVGALGVMVGDVRSISRR